MTVLGLYELRIIFLVQVQLVAQDLDRDLYVLLLHRLEDIPKVGLLYRLVQGLLFLDMQLLLHVHRRVLHRRLDRLLSSALALIDV